MDSDFMVMTESGALEALCSSVPLPPRIRVIGDCGFVPTDLLQDETPQEADERDPLGPDPRVTRLDACARAIVWMAWGAMPAGAGRAAEEAWRDHDDAIELALHDKPMIEFVSRPVGPHDCLAGASRDGRIVRVWLPLVARMPHREADLAIWRGFAYSALMWPLAPNGAARKPQQTTPRRAAALLRRWGIDTQPLSRWLSRHRQDTERLAAQCGRLPNESTRCVGVRSVARARRSLLLLASLPERRRR